MFMRVCVTLCVCVYECVYMDEDKHVVFHAPDEDWYCLCQNTSLTYHYAANKTLKLVEEMIILL